LEIIPIVHRNYDGWTIRWSLPARRPTWDHEFESDFLQRRVTCEPEFLDQTRKVVKCSGAIIDLYYWTTPNGHKVTIFLKETGLAYRILPVNISKGEQFKPDFLRISQQSDPCDRRHRSGGGRPAGP